MKTTRRVKEILLQKGAEAKTKPAFVRLQEFYHQKNEQGVVVKRGYDLPQLDTVGRELYHMLAQGKRQAEDR